MKHLSVMMSDSEDMDFDNETLLASVYSQGGNFYLEHRLVHYRQRYNWDCGVSCVLMLLSGEDRMHFQANFNSICMDEGFDQSTWTIDLCYLLKRFDIKHHFYTMTIGANDDFVEQGYYDKILVKDRDRVNRRFDNALTYSINVTQSSLTFESLLKHLKWNGPIILLIDANVLVCDLCKFNKVNIEWRCCLPFSRPYLGHYIVLVGYNLLKNKFLYRNPSFKERLCAISFRDLEKARGSFGTDEDTILVYKNFQIS